MAQGAATGGESIEINVLGPVEVRHRGLRLPLARRQMALVLGFLALEWPEIIHRDRLVDFLWPENPPRRAHAVLQTRMSELRTALRDFTDGSESSIESTRNGYRLDVVAEAVDAWRFKSAVLGWRRLESEEEACRVLRSTLDLWRGPVLGEWLPGDIYAALSSHLESLRLTAAEDLFGMELRRGNAYQVVDDLLAMSAVHPTRERLITELLLALHATGRGVDALHHYDQWRRSLRRDLGVDPGADLRALHLAILNDDVDINLYVPMLPPVEQRTGPAPERRPQLASDANVPRTLPPDVPSFTGRVEEQRILTNALLQRGGGAGAVAVSGPGGIGKTALCIRVSHAVSDGFKDGQIYLDLHGFDNDAALVPTNALARILRVLCVDGTPIPEDLDERVELYRRLTAPLRLLVVLDNAVSDEQVSPLLPAGVDCRTLINGRTRIGASFGIPVVDLTVLNVDEARVLLSRHVGEARLAKEADSVGALVSRCGGLPLALRIVATKIASKPHWTVKRVVRLLDDERDRLDQLSHAQLDVRTTIALSYNGLADREKALLRRACDLGLLNVTAAAAAALLDESPSVADKVLENLIDSHLFEAAGVDSAGFSWCRMHDLIRLFGSERAMQEESPATLRAARSRAYGLYLAIADEAYRAVFGGDFMAVHGPAPRWKSTEDLVADLSATPLSWFEVERVNIITVVHRAATDGEVAYCWDLACTTSQLFAIRAYVAERAALLTRALEATETLGDLRGQAAVLHRVGMLHLDRREVPVSLLIFDRSAALFSAAGDNHGHAVALLYIGMAQRLDGNAAESLRYYTRAVAGFRQARDIGGEAFTLRGIGQAHMDLGDPEAADECFEQALGLYRSIPQARLSMAQVLFWRGMLYSQLGQHEEAERLFEEVHAITQEVGDRGGQAQALRGLALCQHGRGDRQAATKSFAQALRLLPRQVPHIVEGYIRATIKEFGYESEVYEEGRVAAN